MQIYGETMELDENVDLEAVAEATDGYTGADLRAILYSSQMIKGEEGAFFVRSITFEHVVNLVVYFR